jgi:hypothetical protein
MICLVSPSIVRARGPSPLLNGRAKATTPSRRLPCFHVERSLIRIIPTINSSISIAYTMRHWPSIKSIWGVPSILLIFVVVRAMMPSPLLDGRAKATTPSRRLPCVHVEGSLIRIPTVDSSISIAYTMRHWSSIRSMWSVPSILLIFVVRTQIRRREGVVCRCYIWPTTSLFWVHVDRCMSTCI